MKSSTTINIIANFLENLDVDSCICLLDIDDFDMYNKKYGFEAGNTLLINLEKLVNNFTVFENWTRLNSDEFFFITTSGFETDKIHFFNFLHEVQNKLGITLSIGITSIDVNNYNIKRVFDTLKLNVQFAKEYGKNNIYINT